MTTLAHIRQVGEERVRIELGAWRRDWQESAVESEGRARTRIVNGPTQEECVPGANHVWQAGVSGCKVVSWECLMKRLRVIEAEGGEDDNSITPTP